MEILLSNLINWNSIKYDFLQKKIPEIVNVYFPVKSNKIRYVVMREEKSERSEKFPEDLGLKRCASGEMTKRFFLKSRQLNKEWKAIFLAE